MTEKESKTQILKATGVLGSAQVVIILVGMVRVKVLAVLLGPIGVGIAGIYQATIELIKTATGFGLGYSAVRDIASAAATGDQKKIATTVLVLRRWVWATGMLGILVAVVFSRQLSRIAFDNEAHATDIALLSAALLFSAIAAGQSALLQGLRKIGYLAKATMLAAVVGLVGAVTIYYVWGIRGIVAALLLTYALELTTTWLFSRKVVTVPVQLSLSDTFIKGKSMARLGFFLTLSTLASTGTMYLVRSFISQQEGLASVGYFVAAWSISTMYMSAIFNAMSADYFPRLSAVQHDSVAVTKMVNDQTEVALLLTAPVIIGMVSFVDLLVHIFYSSHFSVTATILNWQLAGDFFKVLGWPMGFILLAKGNGKLYIATELGWNLLFCAGVYFGWKLFGIQITGVAFLVSYFLYVITLYILSARIISFRWSLKIWKSIAFFLPMVVLSFLSSKYLPQDMRYAVGTILMLSAAGYSFVQLKKIVSLDAILTKLRLKKAV